MTSSEAWHRIVIEDLANAESYVAESRRSWVASSLKLIAQINVPVVLFWFSRRAQDYTVDYPAIERQLKSRAAGETTSFFVDGLVGDFPQLIDSASVHEVAKACHAFAECVSSRGMNQPLVNRFTGKAIVDPKLEGGPEYQHFDYTKNFYYPSAEMHEDACAALLPAVRTILVQ
jgi:hypothetical protein